MSELFFVCFIFPASENWSQDRCQARDPKAMAQAKVDTKKLLQFVAGQQINADKAVCSEYQKSSLVICLKLNFVSFPCVIRPIINHHMLSF